jgi:pimeloyl-ACP methyl ester carboxylesterase
MKPMAIFQALLVCLLLTDAAHAQSVKTHMVAVERNVKLEVLDWGGSGRPLVLLPGLGATAHDFDKFAMRFTGKYHVYGITGRGFGNSDKPKPTIWNYSADRLGDDVIAVLNALKIEHPVLAGHSIAGSELSSVASRHPERVSGLIYLDAAYVYAFYTPEIMPMYLNLSVKKLNNHVRKLNQKGVSTGDASIEIDELINSSLPQLESDLRMMKRLQVQAASGASQDSQPTDAVEAILGGVQKYGSVKVPVLAIYARPTRIPPRTSAAAREDILAHDAINERMADLFAKGNPKAKVVCIANSEHDVFNSNPAEVEREMKAFIEMLTR